jgi:hypothetical protein
VEQTLALVDSLNELESSEIVAVQPEPEPEPEPEQPEAATAPEPEPEPTNDFSASLSEPMLEVLARLKSRRQPLHDVHLLQYRSGACAISDALLAAAKRSADARHKPGTTAAERDALMTLLVDLHGKIVEMTVHNHATQWPADPPVRSSSASSLLHLLGLSACGFVNIATSLICRARCQTY